MKSVQFYAGVTDPDWFQFLSALQPDEVNFWRPSDQNNFNAIKAGELFLFKMRGQPYFVGAGVFAYQPLLPLPLAWQTFERKNGATDYKAFLRLIHSRRALDNAANPLRCIIIVQPEFWPQELWIEAGNEWKTGIQKGKLYSTSEQYGLWLWREVRTRIQAASDAPIATEEPRFGEPRLIHPRLGQGAFRIGVTDAYNRRCAITGERTLPALAACHIRPYAEDGPHEIKNGLLLRSDLHNLFDLGYLTITNDYKVRISRKIREEFENGRHYYDLDGSVLQVPAQENERPAREHIEWHQTIFKG